MPVPGVNGTISRIGACGKVLAAAAGAVWAITPVQARGDASTSATRKARRRLKHEWKFITNPLFGWHANNYSGAPAKAQSM
jgi:hypothetical protein